jgi:hypothetical protein
MNSYPILKIPNGLRKALEEPIPPPLKPPEPQLKRHDTLLQYISMIGCFGGAILVVILLMLRKVLHVEEDFFNSLLIVIANIVVVSMILSAITPDSIKKNYRLEEEYRQSLFSYNIELNKYLSNCMNRAEYDKDERRKIVRRELNGTAEIKYENKGVLKGKSEYYFYSYLKDAFPEKIHIDKVAEIFHYSNTYQADIIYWDCSKKIAIDIEIDEPYELFTRKPIHCIKFGFEPDRRRDDYFLQNLNWIVLRFTEEQVIKYPDECIAVISEIINKVENIKPLSITFPTYFLRERWTEIESTKMARERFRESYLDSIYFF